MNRKGILRKKSIVRRYVCRSVAAMLLLTFARRSPIGGFPANSPSESGSKLSLHADWTLQSSCQINATAEQISSAGFNTNGWHSTSVPSTVVAALVADKTYPDPYFGKNLRDIPGTTYPIGKNFSLLPMPKDSPFHCSWWYRTEFKLPENFDRPPCVAAFRRHQQSREHLAQRPQIADAKDVAGAYRTYEYDISRVRLFTARRTLAVETIAQTEKDLGINWVDWNPAPPDKDMGLWRDVYLHASGPVAIRYPQVITHFPSGFARRKRTLPSKPNCITRRTPEVTGILEGPFDDIKFQPDLHR